MSSGGAPSSINFGYHLVVYIDLPGQRRELEKIRRVPQTDDEKEATLRAILQSAGRVHTIRSHFTDLITAVLRVDPAVAARIPPDRRESFLRLRALTIRQVGF